ncbi:MAG: hydroxymethylglutaryl-CoA reductase, degradative [Sandaracinaceae bacterium]|nr:hydroxymethylglutaryl-CoA reductase, degradative [Sandaracinaceae bacterium]
MAYSSALSGFYRLDLPSRRRLLAEIAGLSEEECQTLSPEFGLSPSQADQMIENAIGVFGLPLGVCVNLRVNGRDFLIPMAIEEPSVVAAASHAAKLLRGGEGVRAEVSEPLIVGQVQLLDVPDIEAAIAAIRKEEAELLALANQGHSALLRAGGGARRIEMRRLPPLDDEDRLPEMLIVEIVVDVRDAMGANAVNSMCERLAPRLAELSRGRVNLRILSNLSDRRLVYVEGVVPLKELAGKKESMDGRELGKRIEEASVFAERDPYRAATHNKGIMNGIDAALIALGQDFRAVEAGAHAYAARSGRYTALAKWRVEGDCLVGRMRIPMAVGTVGGVVRVHPVVRVGRKIAGIESAAEMAGALAALGLAQNLAALRALASEGIQRGHMRLHARNLAVEAGAKGNEIAIVAERIAKEGEIRLENAKKVLEEVRKNAGNFKNTGGPDGPENPWNAREGESPIRKVVIFGAPPPLSRFLAQSWKKAGREVHLVSQRLEEFEACPALGMDGILLFWPWLSRGKSGLESFLRFFVQKGGKKIVLVLSSVCSAAHPEAPPSLEEIASWELFVSQGALEGLPIVLALLPNLLGPSHPQELPLSWLLDSFARGLLPFRPKASIDVLTLWDAEKALLRLLDASHPGRRYDLLTERIDFDHFFEFAEEFEGRPRPRMALPAFVCAKFARFIEAFPWAFEETSLLAMLRQAFESPVQLDGRRLQFELGIKRGSIREAVHATCLALREGQAMHYSLQEENEGAFRRVGSLGQ